MNIYRFEFYWLGPLLTVCLTTVLAAPAHFMLTLCQLAAMGLCKYSIGIISLQILLQVKIQNEYSWWMENKRLNDQILTNTFYWQVILCISSGNFCNCNKCLSWRSCLFFLKSCLILFIYCQYREMYSPYFVWNLSPLFCNLFTKSFCWLSPICADIVPGSMNEVLLIFKWNIIPSNIK